MQKIIFISIFINSKLLANLGGVESTVNPWDIFYELIVGRQSLALEVVLEIAEEMARGERIR